MNNIHRYIDSIHISNHSILGNLDINLINPQTGQPYSIVAFVGENGCGKTTLLNELSKLKDYNHVFIRQNSMFVGAVNETYKIITGSEYPYPVSNNINNKDAQLFSNKEKVSPILEELDDKVLIDIFNSDKLDNSRCAARTMKAIDGKDNVFDLDTLSSGQQELLLKLKDLKNANAKTDFVLLDEPETSLHPRWQLKIIDVIQRLLSREDGVHPQIFIATHSEKILESILKREDSLIIRLYKNDKNEIKHEDISEMNLILPRVTLAELDYLIFKIDSFEYCSQLYDLIEWRTQKSERRIDTLIRNSKFYNNELHYKEWFNEHFKDVSAKNIATYCRNYFHHPKDRVEPTKKELHDAIELLRNVILNLI